MSRIFSIAVTALRTPADYYAIYGPHLICSRHVHTFTIDTADDPSTSDKNLVNFGPVTRVLQAPLRRAGYTLCFATTISSFMNGVSRFLAKTNTRLLLLLLLLRFVRRTSYK